MNVHVQATSESDDIGAEHNPPTPSAVPVPFSYTSSNDGTNENLLILLHGLGDTHVPFAKLGKQLNLPQTATLALRAPDQIPYLYEAAYQWYESFDPLGDLLTNPNPTTALEVLSKVIQHLITDCQWSPQKIHLFGFGQGGSLVAEFALLRWKEQITKHPDSFSSPLGSVISISGPLLSYPTVKNKCPTPLFVFHRSPPAESALSSNAITSFKKGFGHLKEAKRAGEGMPNSREDWEPIMKFWSENLSRKQMSGLFQVMSGTTG